jgi:hypothetical protein
VGLLGGLVTAGVTAVLDRDVGRLVWTLARPDEAVREG